MNREIKFRLWSDHGKRFLFFGLHGTLSFTEKELENVEQFTGAIDDDGFPIYEGDIVKYSEIPEGKESIGEIIYCECSCFYAFMIKDKKLDKEIVLGCPIDIKIIGNIYENPEVLNERP